MKKKIVAGAIIALAAGIATVLYKKNRNKIKVATGDQKVNGSMGHFNYKTDEIFS